MGAAWGKKVKQTKVLIVGLDFSGKSTVINHLKPEKEKENYVQATVGFMVERFRYGDLHFTMFDMSGQAKYRNLWEHYYTDTDAVIFVVDSADAVRMCVVKDELNTILAHKDIAARPVPILFFANKMDLEKACNSAELSKLLELPRILDRPWRIIASNAVTGAGLEDGMKWLSSLLK